MKAICLALMMTLLFCAPACAEQEIIHARVGTWIDPGEGVLYRVEGATCDAERRVTAEIIVQASGDAPVALSLESFVLMVEKTNAAYWPESAVQRESGWLLGADGVEIPAGMVLMLDWTFVADNEVMDYQLVYLDAPDGAFYATPLSFTKPKPTPTSMSALRPVPTNNHAPVPVRTSCFACRGSGVCAQCHGTGTTHMYGQSSACTACGSDRKCSICGGLGYYEHWQ